MVMESMARVYRRLNFELYVCGRIHGRSMLLVCLRYNAFPASEIFGQILEWTIREKRVGI